MRPMGETPMPRLAIPSIKPDLRPIKCLIVIANRAGDLDFNEHSAKVTVTKLRDPI